MFITSLITPLILLVLYATFLANVYRDSFASAIPQGFSVPEALISGTVGGQLISSLLAVELCDGGFLYESADGAGQGDRNAKRPYYSACKALHSCAGLFCGQRGGNPDHQFYCSCGMSDLSECDWLVFDCGRCAFVGT